MILPLRAFATLTEWINHLFGTDLPIIPPNTYGTFVALGFLAATIVVIRELRRREGMNLIKGYYKEEIIGGPPSRPGIIWKFILGYILGWKVLGIFVNFEVFAQSPGDYVFSNQGVWPAGLALGGFWAWYQYKKEKGLQQSKPKVKKTYVPSYDQIGDLVFIAALFGVFGAKVFEVLQPQSTTTFADLLDPRNWMSGLTIFGGLIMAGLAIVVFAKKRGLHMGHLFDALGPAFILALGIGRLGCHFSGDGDWGKPNTMESPSWLPDYFWSNDYAHAVIGGDSDFVWETIPNCSGEYCYKLAEGVWPTSIYEFLMCLVFFLILWSMRKRFTLRPGFLFSLSFIFIAIERFFIEFARVTKRFEGINLTQAQVISIGLFILGLAGVIYFGYIKKSEKVKTS